MASYQVAQGAHGAYSKLAAANTVDTITFSDDLDSVEIVSDGAAALYATVDGSTPTVGGATTYELPVGARTARRIVVGTAGGTVIKVISSGAPTYSVSDATTSGLVASSPGSGSTQLVESASTAKGYQQLTSTAAAATIASLCTGAALPAGATKVLLTPSAQVRVRDDGTNPSATVGYPIPASTEWRYDADQLAALKVYGAATIDAYFYA